MELHAKTVIVMEPLSSYYLVNVAEYASDARGCDPTTQELMEMRVNTTSQMKRDGLNKLGKLELKIQLKQLYTYLEFL